MRITKVEYLNGYRLKISFSDKKVKIIDLEEKVKNAKGIFLPLKNLEYFKKVSLDDCQLSICWPNGADICPDVLYNMGTDSKIQRNKLKKTGVTKNKTDGLRGKTMKRPVVQRQKPRVKTKKKITF